MKNILKIPTLLFILSALFFLFSSVLYHTERTKLEIAHQQYKEDEVQIGEAYNQLSDLYTECQSYLEMIDVVHKYSIEYDIPPELVLAIIKLESNFDVQATNGQYIGLMQIDEDVFKSRMEGLKLEKNIECGVSLLSGLKQQSDDLHYILNSYNMGKAGYADYVERTGKISREYSRRGIQIINELRKESNK